ncbi:tripartite motif-containing protein 2-like [Patiria miniata]|uniref:Tripartite motif-containing protein 2-like n=1 Tax=Patiria miniata TaxID=46514 RepID=A0A913ZL53_PATMI|nr:tripartite motif-containing protein 2-like [Patiria miniata]
MAEAAAQTVLDNISQGHLECPICYCRFKDPKMLDCLHSFCLNCLVEMMRKQKTEAKKITCPVCRKETQVPDEGLQSLSSSFFLISLVDEINKQEQLLGKSVTSSAPCESCEEGQEAVSTCLDCKENICKKCEEAHQFLRYTKHHRIIPAQDLDKSTVAPTDLTKTVAPKCRKHIKQPLCFHCETCDTLICLMCAATEHRSAEHNFIGITDAIESFRKSVTDILQTFEKSKEQFASNEDSINHARKRLQKKLAQARSDISAQEEAEIAKIRNKAKLLTEKVDEIGQERDSEYEKALKHNREQMERADQIVTAVNDLMRQADDIELLELKPKVMHNLEFQKELKCEPAKVDMAFIGVKCQDVVSDTNLGEILLNEKWHLKEEFGKEGTGDGKFQWAAGVACFSNGDVVVTDVTQKRLSLFTSNGQFKTSVDQGTDSNQLENPWRVGVNCDDLLFVTDEDKVKIFDNKLQFVREFTPSVDDAEGPSKSDLSGIAVDKQRVAVIDWGRKVISVHNLDGSLIASTSNHLVRHYIAMSNKERLIFTNYKEKRLMCVDLKGNEVFNVMTVLNGKPAKPTGVLCDDDGSIYVALHCGTEGDIDEVHQYDSNGAFISTVAQGLYNPLGMAFTPAGDVLVACRHSVKIFERM